MAHKYAVVMITIILSVSVILIKRGPGFVLVLSTITITSNVNHLVTACLPMCLTQQS